MELPDLSQENRFRAHFKAGRLVYSSLQYELMSLFCIPRWLLKHGEAHFEPAMETLRRWINMVI